MKRTRLFLAAAFALPLVVSPVLAQTYSQPQQQASQPPATTSSTTQNESATTPSNTTTEPTTSTSSTTPSSTTSSGKLPATASPVPLVIGISLAAMAAGAWLSRPRAHA